MRLVSIASHSDLRVCGPAGTPSCGRSSVETVTQGWRHLGFFLYIHFVWDTLKSFRVICGHGIAAVSKCLSASWLLSSLWVPK